MFDQYWLRRLYFLRPLLRPLRPERELEEPDRLAPLDRDDRALDARLDPRLLEDRLLDELLRDELAPLLRELFREEPIPLLLEELLREEPIPLLRDEPLREEPIPLFREELLRDEVPRDEVPRFEFDRDEPKTELRELLDRDELPMPLLRDVRLDCELARFVEVRELKTELFELPERVALLPLLRVDRLLEAVDRFRFADGVLRFVDRLLAAELVVREPDFDFLELAEVPRVLEDCEVREDRTLLVADFVRLPAAELVFDRLDCAVLPAFDVMPLKPGDDVRRLILSGRFGVDRLELVEPEVLLFNRLVEPALFREAAEFFATELALDRLLRSEPDRFAEPVLLPRALPVRFATDSRDSF